MRHEPTMGLIFARVALSNPKQPELSPLEIEALADSGSVTLCIPEHVKLHFNCYHSPRCAKTQSF